MKKRPITVNGDIAYIPLSRGEFAVIDAGDVALASEINWSILVLYRKDRTVRGVYAVGNTPRTGQKRKQILLHRWLMGDTGGLTVDHVNCDGLDNRRSNLRLATRSQNQHNQRLNRKNTSGVKGVSSGKDGKWRACIKLNKVQHRLGAFNNKEDAAAAYKEASARLHGEFGRLG